MAKEKILIVEDESIIASHLQTMLESMGYVVTGISSTGQDAVQKALDTHPDLILMDIRLEGEMDGIEAAEKIRSQLDVPVIYVTAYADEATLERAKATEPYGYLLKPFKQKDVQSAMEMALYKHKAEQRLRASEERFRQIAENIREVFWLTDWVKNKVLYVSPTYEVVWGRPPQSLLDDAKSWSEAIHPEDRPRVVEAFAKKAGLGEYDEIYRIVREDGAIRWIHDRAFPILDADGNVWRVAGISEDVTELKQAEEELRKHRDHLEELVEERTAELREEVTERKRAEDEIKRRAENLKAVNELAIELAAAPADVDLFELIGEKLKEITGALATVVTTYDAETGELAIRYLGVPENDLLKIDKLLKRKAVGIRFKVTPQMFERMVTEVATKFKDLSELTLGEIPKSVASAIQTMFGVGEILGLVLHYGGEIMGTAAILMPKETPPLPFEIMHIIANLGAVALRRKRVEEALRRSEDRFRRFAGTVTDMIYRYDTQRKDYDFISASCELLTGYSLEDFQADPVNFWNTLIHPDDIERVREERERQLSDPESGISFNLDYRIVRKDNKVIFVNEHGDFEVDEKGRITSFNGVVRDITEQKRAEQALKRRVKTSTVLAALTRDLYPAESVQEVLDVTIKHLSEMFPFFVSVSLIEERKGKRFLPLKAYHVEPKILSFAEKLVRRRILDWPVPLYEESVALRTMSTGHPTVIGLDFEPDEPVVETDLVTVLEAMVERKSPLRHLAKVLAKEVGEKSLLSIPFSNASGEIIGSLTVVADFRFSRDDYNLVKVASDMIGRSLGQLLLADELRASEERYRTLQANVPVGVFRTTPEGNLLYANPAMLRMLGYTSMEEFKPVPIEQVYVSPQKREELAYILSKEGSVTDFEVQIRRKDGSTFWASLNATAVTDEKRKIVHYDGIFEDVTERKQQELLRQVRAQLLDKLRETKAIEDCLRLGCEAIRDARLFERAVFTTKNENGETTHVGYVGLDPKIVEELSRRPPASKEMLGQMLCEEFKISRSYFIPVEAGVDFEQTGRYVPQEVESGEGPGAWKKGDELMISMLSKDGSTESYLSVDTPFDGKRPDEATVLYLEDIVDIVARQIHEIQNLNALQKSEELQRALFEGGTDPVIITDLDDIILAVNPAVERMFGYSAEEIIGGTFPGHYGIDEGKFEEWVQACRSGKGISGYETVRRAKSGELIPVSITISPVCNANGDLVSLSFWYRDISMRRKAEEALRESEERYRVFTEEAMVGIYIYSNSKRRYLFVNPEMVKITGYSRQELLEIDPNELPVPEDSTVLKEREKAILEGKPVEAECTIRIRRKDGSLAILSVRTHRIRYAGEDVALGNCIDITQRTRVEQALKREHETFRIIAQAAVQGADTTDFCIRVLKGLIDALEFDAGTIRLYEANSRLLKLGAFCGLSRKEEEMASASQPIEDPHYVAAFVARAREPIIAPDVAKDERLKPFRSRLEEFSERSLISWPLLGTKDNLLGVLHLWSRTPVDISEEDRTFFERIAVMFASVFERRHAEEERDRHRQELQALFDHVDVLLWSIVEGDDGELYYEQVNSAFASVEGYTPDHYNGRAISELHHPEECEGIMHTYEWIQSGKVHISEVHFKQRHFIMRFIPLVEPDGQIRRFIGTGVDITERKRAEETVKNRLFYEETVTHCSQVLVETMDLSEALQRVTEELLAVVGVSRVFMFENFEDTEYGTSMRQIHEAVSESGQSLIRDPRLQNLPYDEVSRELFERLFSGRPYGGSGEELNVQELGALVSKDARSVLILPIRVEDQFWGFIGLEDCISERKWRQEDIQLLRTVGSMVGTTIRRKQAEGELQRHTRAMEGMYDLSKQINRAFNLEDLLKRVGAILADNPRVVSGGIFLLDSNSESMRLVNSFGSKPEFFNRMVTLSVGDPDVKSVIEASGAVVLDGFAERNIGEDLAKAVNDSGQIAGVAMRAGGETLGTFYIILSSVDDQTMAFLEMVGAELGTGIKRRQAEEALRDSEERYRALTEEAMVGVYIYREDRFLFVNPAMEEITQYSQRELLKIHIADIVLPEDNAVLRARFEARERGEDVPAQYTMRIRRKNGEVAVLEVRTRPVIYAGGKAYLVNCVDITEMRRVQEALQVSEERYRVLTEEAMVGVYLIVGGRFLFVNPAMEKITGYSRKELLELDNFYSIMHPDDIKALEARVKHRKPGEPDQYTMRTIRKDGEIATLEVRVHSIPYGDKMASLGNCVDITEMRKVQEALQASEERYRVLTEEAMVGIYLVMGKRFLFVNPAMERITGYSREELLEMDIHSTIPLEDLKAIEERKQRRQPGEPDQYTMRIIRKNGEIATLEVRVRPVAYGDEVAFLGNCVDITELIRQRVQIERAKKEWERTFDSISDLVMILDPEHRIIRTNRAVAEYTGLEFTELLGKSYLEVFNLSEAPHASGSKLPEHFEIHDRVQDRTFSISASPFLDPSGETLATVHVARDITQMRMIEEALAESEAQFRGLAESAHDIIFSLDHDGTVGYVNPAIKETFGYDPGELVGENLKSVLENNEELAAGLRPLVEVLEFRGEGGRTPLFEAEVEDVKGRKHVLEIAARRLPRQIVGIARDVTERKRMQQQLVHASKLASVGVLAAGIAHQVNNPLAIILATTSLLRTLLTETQGIPSDAQSEASKYLDTMEEQVERTNQVVSGLLEFTKARRSEVQPFDVNSVVTESLNLLSQHLSLDKISIDTELSKDLPQALGDPSALQQVIVNVVQNSFEAMEGSGKLTVRTEDSASGMIRIVVSDTGPGIPPTLREEIFEPLFTTKTDKRGTGLGLAISVMLLERFGGRIYLEDTPGGGATFVIEVPVQEREEHEF